VNVNVCIIVTGLRFVNHFTRIYDGELAMHKYAYIIYTETVLV